jgi:hypothetical protein
MNHTLALGVSFLQIVNLIMALKPLDCIVGQPTTDTMDCMTEQMSQMVAQAKTTNWSGLHSSLALVLNNKDYQIVTKKTTMMTACIDQPVVVHSDIITNLTPFKTLGFQETQKVLQIQVVPQEFPLISFLRNFLLECTLPKIKIIVGEMARPCTCSKAKIGPRPLLDFAPPQRLSIHQQNWHNYGRIF